MNEQHQCKLCASWGDDNAALKQIGGVGTYPLLKCDSCSIEMIYPQPDDATLANIYTQQYYNAWGLQEDKELVGKMKRSTFSKLLKKLKVHPQATLLDCGAATGFLMECARSRGASVYGIELSEFGADSIAKTFGQDRVFRGQIEDSSFADVSEGTFDIITMTDFIEHTRDPISVLKKAHSLLARNGRLLITTPNASSFSRKVMGKYWPHYKLEHLYYFSPQNLNKLLEHLGFQIDIAAKARKSMNLQYISNQLTIYPLPVATQLLKLTYRLLPRRISEMLFPTFFGEMLIVATKQ
jgi:2-polyprenyl-3-methyl-5-hydroxy-6-metoxy-1,4-benzoquinol methylase